MTWPLAPPKILIVAGSDDMPISQVCFVDPIFVKQDVIFAPATEAAVEDMIAARQRQARCLPDNHRSRTQLRPQYAKTAKCRLWSQLVNNPRDRRAMPIRIDTATGNCAEFTLLFDNRHIIRKSCTGQRRMACFDARIQHRYTNALSASLTQKIASLFQGWPMLLGFNHLPNRQFGSIAGIQSAA